MKIEVKNDAMLGRTNNTTLHIELMKLQQENKQLKDNWNELKKYLEEKMSIYEYQEASNFYVVLDKIKELEEGVK